MKRIKKREAVEKQTEIIEDLFISYAEGSKCLNDCVGKIKLLILGLEIIGDGNPISVSHGEAIKIAETTLDKFFTN